MRKILIIEDEDGIRRLLRYDLRQLGFEVDSAKDGAEAIEYVNENDYDVIVIDWMLPVYDGITLVERFRNDGNMAIIVMLTAKDEESDILEAFEAGVDDYLSKPFSPRELTARINAHLKRVVPKENNDKVVVGNVVLFPQQHKVEVDELEVELTKKEYDLLVYFMDNLNLVLSRDQILTEIWNFDYDGDTRIVDVHVFKLRQKLKYADIKIDSLRGVGYVAKG
ncbi:response regulator transcription factor [Erysipelothrix urinaevulpis]|uniref:response regulator transcription factor n=1 Tax=Erysipelothrix urinaevulpis TaxID=2683717 RepID=UPI00135A3AB4|nr:response regulator transcription factor [Erysipelothrix urinaevulpis]